MHTQSQEQDHKNKKKPCNDQPVNLQTVYLGQTLQSPFILSSGPLSYAAEGMIRAHHAGCGAIVTKTLRLETAQNPVNHIARYENNSLLNCEQWADIPWENWCSHEIPQTIAAGGVVIASIGQTAEEVRVIAPAMEAAGAQMIELVSYTEESLLPMLEVAKNICSIPIICKLSGNWPDPAGVATRCIERGADGLCAVDSIGPVLEIDIENKRPRMYSDDGYAWLTGAAVRPISLRINATIARANPHFKGLYSSGGCMNARNAVEFAMIGAAAVGICTAPILHGLGYVEKLCSDLSSLLKQLGYNSFAQATGAALPNFPQKQTTGRLEFTFTPFRENGKKLCSECGKCVRVCSYAARTLQFPEMQVDENMCRDCGACVSVCPTGALRSRVVPGPCFHGGSRAKA